MLKISIDVFMSRLRWVRRPDRKPVISALAMANAVSAAERRGQSGVPVLVFLSLPSISSA
jgi:hypothetical protein